MVKDWPGVMLEASQPVEITVLIEPLGQGAADHAGAAYMPEIANTTATLSVLRFHWGVARFSLADMLRLPIFVVDH